MSKALGARSSLNKLEQLELHGCGQKQAEQRLGSRLGFFDVKWCLSNGKLQKYITGFEIQVSIAKYIVLFSNVMLIKARGT